jgi:riboflavin kinase/FMN adenylyltransferase
MKPCSILTIGNFDGVHVGHSHIINHLIKFASSSSYREEFFEDNPALRKHYHLDLQTNPASGLLTFNPHPASVLGNKFYIPLMPHEKRLQTLKNFPLHRVEELPFTKEFSQKSSEEFCEFLVKKYNIAMLFIGHDFKIGHDRAEREKLIEHGKKLGFAVYAHEPVRLDTGEVISSTQIRENLLAGNIQKANSMLGYAYTLSGTVQHGFNRGGKLLGFPTANLLEKTLIVPKNGVYATKVKIFDSRFVKNKQAQVFHGMTNIGYNPTFNNNARSIETCIFDFDADIYEKDIEISFYHLLREERKFNSINELKEQLTEDKYYAQKLLTGK